MKCDAIKAHYLRTGEGVDPEASIYAAAVTRDIIIEGKASL